MAEKEGFGCLLFTLDPRYEIPSTKYFSSVAIPSLYEKTREKVAAEIKIHYRYVVQLNNGTIFEIFSTLHHDDWVLQSQSLQTVFVPKDHNAEISVKSLRKHYSMGTRSWQTG